MLVAASLLAGYSLADAPANLEERENFTRTKLGHLPLSAKTQAVLKRKSDTKLNDFWRSELVIELAMLEPVEFARSFARHPSVSTELLQMLNAKGLRLGMTAEEMRRYITNRESFAVTAQSKVTVLAASSRIHEALRLAAITEVGQITNKVIDNLKLNRNFAAADRRQLRHVLASYGLLAFSGATSCNKRL